MIEKVTSRSAHKQSISENEQVAIALRPRLMGPLLEQLFELEMEHIEGQNGTSRGRGRSYECRILDTKYEPGNYCRILYQLGDDLVIGEYKWDSNESQIPETTKVIPSLGMRVYRFPNDPALPSLAKALDPQMVSAALAEALPEFQANAARVLRCDVKLLRFRPGRRCTVQLHVWLREKESGAIYNRVLYGKIYHDLEKARSVYQQMLSLSSSVPAKDGLISFATASAFLPDLAMVLQDPIAGVSLENLMSCDTKVCDPRGFAGTMMAAAALAAFHNSSGVVAGKERSIRSELVRFKKRGAEIGQVDPGLSNNIIKLADALSAWLDTLDLWGATTCLVHGDCKPAQFLINNQQIVLLDFDHGGMADPAVDVGTFLATLQQMQIKETLKNRGRPVPCASWLPGLKRQFLEVYCSASGYPSEFWHLAEWYEAVALLRKTIRAFQRSPFSPLPAALVTEAWKGLETLPPPS
ncbi:MAG TPA: phosphotransferase [Anaerolineales bacterium]|nr:phosphotransferase [Anaerolineales bacterium]